MSLSLAQHRPTCCVHVILILITPALGGKENPQPAGKKSETQRRDVRLGWPNQSVKQEFYLLNLAFLNVAHSRVRDYLGTGLELDPWSLQMKSPFSQPHGGL